MFLLYLAVYSDLFKIKVIEIKGTDLIDPAAIRQIVNEQINSWRWFLLPQNNLLLLSQKRITRAVNAKYRLEKIEIHRGWQKLKIEVKEKVNYLIVIDKSKSFFTDEQGLIVREITPAEMADYSAKLPLLNTDQEIKVGDQVVKKEIEECVDLGFKAIMFFDDLYCLYSSLLYLNILDIFSLTTMKSVSLISIYIFYFNNLNQIYEIFYLTYFF